MLVMGDSNAEVQSDDDARCQKEKAEWFFRKGTHLADGSGTSTHGKRAVDNGNMSFHAAATIKIGQSEDSCMQICRFKVSCQ